MSAILDYARLAQRAYSEPPTYGRADDDARMVVFENGVVGFPGTNNLASVMADLHATVDTTWGMGKVHAGFLDAAQEIALPLLCLPEVRVLVGHSLGAALAILSGAALCLIGKPPEAIYGFEPPRVSADDTLAKLFRQHGVKVVLTRHKSDPVTEIPRLLENWQHSSPLEQCGHAGPVWQVNDHRLGDVIATLETLEARSWTTPK